MEAAGVRVELVDSDADAELLDRMTRDLRAELLDLDVDDVTSVLAPAPPGSKGMDVAAAAALLVHTQDSLAALRVVVTAVRAWLSRGKQPELSVRVTIGDRTLELSSATAEQQERLVEEFLRSGNGPAAEG